MDLLSSDIIINVIFPLMPPYMLVVLQHASKRYHQLVLSGFPNKSQNHLEMLVEICKDGLRIC